MLVVPIDLNNLEFLDAELHDLRRKVLNVFMSVSCLLKSPNENFELKNNKSRVFFCVRSRENPASPRMARICMFD
mgnify:CR=1 FL=1